MVFIFLPVCNGQVCLHPLFKSGGIFLPGQVMQKYTHTIESDRLRISQFPVDRCSIKTFRLPHFQLIDGRARNKITTPQPSLFSCTTDWRHVLTRPDELFGQLNKNNSKPQE